MEQWREGWTPTPYMFDTRIRPYLPLLITFKSYPLLPITYKPYLFLPTIVKPYLPLLRMPIKTS